MLHELDLSVTLNPIWHSDPPQIKICCHDISKDLLLNQKQTIDFRYLAQGPQRLSIYFLNKTDQDTQPHLGLDKAVVIESISFFGISDPRFVWLGVYAPIYPEPWASEQRQQGNNLPAEITFVDRLSWNGHWHLDFDLPIFTWMHRVQNHGWLYD